MAALQVIFAVCTVLVAVQARAAPCDAPCKVRPYELSFVVDASSSVGYNGWNMSMQFLKAVVDFFEISDAPEGTRVAVTTYARETHANFELDTYTDKPTLQWAIQNLEFEAGGYTDTGSGITSGIQQMKTRRPLVRTVMVVLTDGNSQEADKTAAAAIAAREEDIVTYVVGVGATVPEQELLNIAGDPGRIARVKTYEQINDILGLLQARLCTGQTYPVCRYSPTDVTFIIDSSSSINVGAHDAYSKGLEFITKVIDHFEVTPKYTRVAAVTFSTDVHGDTAIEFDDNTNKTALNAAIMNLRNSYAGGNTFTDRGLQFAMQHFLPQTREGVAKVAILVTDGSVTHSQYDAAVAQSALVREGFGTLIAVGIGEAINNQAFQQELAVMAGGEMNVLLAGDYEHLQEVIEPLVIRTCEEVAAAYGAPADNIVDVPAVPQPTARPPTAARPTVFVPAAN